MVRVKAAARKRWFKNQEADNWIVRGMMGIMGVL